MGHGGEGSQGQGGAPGTGVPAVECQPGPAGGLLLWQCGLAPAEEQGRQQLARVLDDGSALRTFEAMLGAQGVPPNIAHRLCAGTPPERRQVLGQAGTREELPALHGGKPWVCPRKMGSALPRPTAPSPASQPSSPAPYPALPSPTLPPTPYPF